MKRIVVLVFFALLLQSRPLAAAPIVPPHPELGHVLVLTQDAQVYVKTDGKAAIFSALLPFTWSYSVLVDGNQDGIWGDGPYGKEGAGHSRSDFAYAQAKGTLCFVYILSSYPGSPDVTYASSPCGARKTAATLEVRSASDAVSLQTFSIPMSELRNGPGEVHFSITIWNGYANSVFASPSAPYILMLAPKNA